MNIQRIQSLLNSQSTSIPEVARSTGISIRTLFRIKAGEQNINLRTLTRLQTWAKGRRVVQ